MGFLYVCMYITFSALCPQRPEEGVVFPGTGIRDGCGPPCGWWELNQILWKSSKCSKLLNHLFSPLSCMCVYAGAFVDQRQPWVFLRYHSSAFWNISLVWNWLRLGWFGREPQAGRDLPVLALHPRITITYCYTDSGDTAQVLRLSRQAFYWLKTRKTNKA